MPVLDRSEFHYHVIRSLPTWQEGLLHQLELDEQGIRIQMANDYRADAPIRLAELLPAGAVVADVAEGPNGMLLLFDKTSAKVYAFNPMTMRLDRPGGIVYALNEAVAMAYSSGIVYLLERTSTEVLQAAAYSAITGQPLWSTDVPVVIDGEMPLVDFLPCDITADSSGYCYVTLTHTVQAARFDQGGRFVDWIAPPQQLAEQAGGRQTAAIGSDSTLYVVDTDRKQLYIYPQHGVGEPQQVELGPLTAPRSIAVDNLNVLYIGQDSIIQLFNAEGTYIGPLTAYSGAADRIVFSGSSMFLFDRTLQSVAYLRREPALFRESGSPISKGEYISRSIDCTEEGLRWHKLQLDRTIPDNTLIRVSYLIADSTTFRIDGSNQNLDDYLKKPGVRSSDKIAALSLLPWSETSINPRDMLIRGEAGRYLWVRIQLYGSDKQSPVIAGIRAHFPRLSYLRYLPAVYQEDPASKDLLERFLSMFETFLSELDGQIETSPRWLDVDAVNAEYMRWLATWIGVLTDQGWTESKMRRLIKGMPDIHRKRGTKEGMERLLELYTNERPIIFESCKVRSIEESEAKNAYAALFGDDPYRFSVLLKPRQIAGSAELATVKRMIASDQPAHTGADVVWLQPWIYLGGHTYLEVNTYLTKPLSLLYDDSVMQRDSMLEDGTPFGQLDVRSGLGADTRLL
ncbi:phage tail-like protein [Paenibacillus cellulosilyticus]|uniref:Phage tail-like protein n=1 Tax=Paenibacillus cellulosilyticus TaxID=375489 RepID=A0A2V2YNV7_9BACL|nr:phage tail-like protein [Paenibacillus cellulosilyticus]